MLNLPTQLGNDLTSSIPEFSLTARSRWQANAYTHVTFSVPNNWKAGRIWVCTLFGIHLSKSEISSAPTRDVVTVISMTPIPPLNVRMVAAMVAWCATLTPERYEK